MKSAYAFITLDFHVPGDQRTVDLELLLKQVAVAIRGRELCGGQHELVIHRDGSMTLDGENAFRPRKLPVAGKGE